MDIDAIAEAWATDDELEILNRLDNPTNDNGSIEDEDHKPTQCFKFRWGVVWTK